MEQRVRLRNIAEELTSAPPPCPSWSTEKPEKCQTRRTIAPFRWRQYAAMLLPVLVGEALWSVSENVCAAMTLTNW